MAAVYGITNQVIYFLVDMTRVGKKCELVSSQDLFCGETYGELREEGRRKGGLVEVEVEAGVGVEVEQ